MAVIKKLLSFLFLFISILALGYFGLEVVELIKLKNASEAERLALIWEKDLQLLIEQKKMPPGWERIREVALIGGTSTARDWIKKITSPVKVHKDGDHRLEVLLLDWKDEGNEGAIVQYNLIDLKTGNMTWELGRTYVLKEAPKKLQEPLSPAAPEPSAAKPAEPVSEGKSVPSANKPIKK